MCTSAISICDMGYSAYMARNLVSYDPSLAVSIPACLHKSNRKGGQTMIADIWNQIQLNNALQAMVEGAGTQVAELLPIGIGLMFVLAIPRIIRRVLNTFM